jgi:FdhE protein
VRREIDEAVAGIARVPAPSNWDNYVEDYMAGVPLLQSAMPIDLHAAGQSLINAFDELSLEEPGATPERVIAWLLGDDAWKPTHAGLVRCVGWIGLAGALQPIVYSLTAWKDDERWLRRYCPCCGALPSMAQLVGVDPGRRRYLTCGGCSTQWRYRRTMCPFCEADAQKLVSIAIEGESGLRVDYCESCSGYLKTYDGQGDEAVLLADWTSLHLDQLALDKGLQRSATSLYEFDLSFASTRVAASAST